MLNLWRCSLNMFNAKYAEGLNSFGHDFSVCHPKTSYLSKVIPQVSVPAAFSVQRSQQRGAAVFGGVPSPWGAGYLADVPGHSAPAAAWFLPCNQAVTHGYALTLSVGVKSFHLLLGDLAAYLL